MLVAARLGHTSTRMVEQHDVSLFDGLDREIVERLGSMRARRRKESERLRPADSVSGTGPRRDGDGTALMTELHARAEKAR